MTGILWSFHGTNVFYKPPPEYWTDVIWGEFPSTRHWLAIHSPVSRCQLNLMCTQLEVTSIYAKHRPWQTLISQSNIHFHRTMYFCREITSFCRGVSINFCRYVLANFYRNVLADFCRDVLASFCSRLLPWCFGKLLPQCFLKLLPWYLLKHLR